MSEQNESTSWRQRKLCLSRAWRGACPQCGQGRLFVRYARLAERCGTCGLVYRREQGAMTGSMYLSAVATEIFAAAIVLLIFFATDFSVRTSLLVGVPLVLAFSAFWLPRAMALWVGVEYMTDLGNRESWVALRVEQRSPHDGHGSARGDRS